MSQNLLSPRLFFRDLLVNLISGLAGGALVGVISGHLWLGLLAFFLIVLVLFFAWLRSKYERMIKFVLSGDIGYYYSFDMEENPRVWQEAGKSFYYLGISADSILEQLRRWIDEHPLSEYRILLRRPDSDSLKRQEAFEKGHGLDVEIDSLPPDVRKAVEEAAAATSARIRSAIAVLKGSTAFSRDGRIEIKLYDEFSPSWMYIIDNRRAYVGILEKGKRGSHSPVMTIGKSHRYAGPFDFFHNHWERLWNDATHA